MESRNPFLILQTAYPIIRIRKKLYNCPYRNRQAEFFVLKANLMFVNKAPTIIPVANSPSI